MTVANKEKQDLQSVEDEYLVLEGLIEDIENGRCRTRFPRASVEQFRADLEVLRTRMTEPESV